MWAFGFGGSGCGIRVVEETQFSSSVARFLCRYVSFAKETYRQSVSFAKETYRHCARFLCAWDTDVGFRF